MCFRSLEGNWSRCCRHQAHMWQPSHYGPHWLDLQLPAPAFLCLRAFSSWQNLLCPPVLHSGSVCVLTSLGNKLQAVNERNRCINTPAILSLREANPEVYVLCLFSGFPQQVWALVDHSVGALGTHTSWGAFLCCLTSPFSYHCFLLFPDKLLVLYSVS